MKHEIQTKYGKSNIYSADSHASDAEQVLVIPGFSETITHSKDLVDALAAEGLDASTFSQPRQANSESSATEDPILRQGNVVLRLAESITPKGEKIHAVAHSLGSAAVLKAAQIAPELFASITIMQTPGMVGKQSLSGLAGRVSKKVINNQKSSLRSQDPNKPQKNGSYVAAVDKESALQYATRTTKAQLAGGRMIMSQPILASREAIATSRYDISDDISKVTELGVPVHIVGAQGDELFDHEKVDESYRKIAHTASSISSVADRKAGHDTFWMQPKRTAAIVEQLIHEEHHK